MYIFRAASKITKLILPFLINQYIFHLDIPMSDAFTMQKFQDIRDNKQNLDDNSLMHKSTLILFKYIESSSK